MSSGEREKKRVLSRRDLRPGVPPEIFNIALKYLRAAGCVPAAMVLEETKAS